MQFTFSLAQINPVLGDIAGNVALMKAAYAQAVADDADLLIFPEMTVTGYPPEDLVFKSAFRAASMEAVFTLAALTKTHKTDMIVGSLWLEGSQLYNATFLLSEGEICYNRGKWALPNYGVFDEKRVYAKGGLPKAFAWRGIKLGILVCEELWDARCRTSLAASAPDITIVQNASPYERGKEAERLEVSRDLVEKTGAPDDISECDWRAR